MALTVQVLALVISTTQLGIKLDAWSIQELFEQRVELLHRTSSDIFGRTVNM
jgi:hypothetical protein